MNENPQILDFVKAVSDPDRLRVIGVLAQHPATIREVAAALDIPFRKAFSHLGMLEFAGVVHKEADLFTLDPEAMESLSRQQFAAQSPAVDPVPAGVDEKRRKVLANFLKPPVELRQLPAQPAKLRLVLEHVVTAFEPGAQYTEKQVNEVLRRFHPDAASLRRYLVDAGLISRESDGSRYWRSEASPQ
jgi:hypothetical protein